MNPNIGKERKKTRQGEDFRLYSMHLNEEQRTTIDNLAKILGYNTKRDAILTACVEYTKIVVQNIMNKK